MSYAYVWYSWYDGRSRKGAWIEMAATEEKSYSRFCRSRKGAWIEIAVLA